MAELTDEQRDGRWYDLVEPVEELIAAHDPPDPDAEMTLPLALAVAAGSKEVMDISGASYLFEGGANPFAVINAYRFIGFDDMADMLQGLVQTYPELANPDQMSRLDWICLQGTEFAEAIIIADDLFFDRRLDFQDRILELAEQHGLLGQGQSERLSQQQSAEAGPNGA